MESHLASVDLTEVSAPTDNVPSGRREDWYVGTRVRCLILRCEIGQIVQLPKDLILPEYEMLEPFKRLLRGTRSTLAKFGLDYRLEANGSKSTINPATQTKDAAA